MTRRRNPWKVAGQLALFVVVVDLLVLNLVWLVYETWRAVS